MSLALLFNDLMLNMFRMLIHPSSGACDLFVELFHGLYRHVGMYIYIYTRTHTQLYTNIYLGEEYDT